MITMPQAIIDETFGEKSLPREYQKLKETIVSLFDERVWFMTEACASVVAALMLEDLSNPIGLNLVDGPSSEKTTVLSFFFDLPHVYRSDSFTPACFVSHAANVKTAKLPDVDLLPRIRHKCLVVPELAPVFGADREKLLENFSILTRVFDGEGLWRDGGVHGGRGYVGDYHFVWLGATTPIKPYVWKLMGHLGSRLLFLTVETHRNHRAEVQRALDGLTADLSYRQKVAKCRSAVKVFFEYLQCVLGQSQFARSVSWNRKGENETVLKAIAELADVTARARSTVSVWRPDDQGGEEDFSMPIRERPMRLASLLYGLARGHALLSGRTRLEVDELPLVVAVSLSSMPDDRRRVVDLMLSRHHPEKISPFGRVTSSEISKILGFSAPTARKVLKALSILELGNLAEGTGPNPLSFELNSDLDWLRSDRFAEHRLKWAEIVERDAGAPF